MGIVLLDGLVPGLTALTPTLDAEILPELAGEIGLRFAERCLTANQLAGV